ncbi:MAG: ATP synthase subunit I [Terriglobales bacterium]
MTIQKHPETLTTDPNRDAFYAGAIDRISRFMRVLAVGLTAVLWWRYGWRVAVGFICGSAVAYLNFHWLKRVVSALADRATQPGHAPSSTGVVLWFLFRYVLMGLGAYVIFAVSPASLYGLFAGLFLPVAAIACEAAYETWVALARGI